MAGNNRISLKKQIKKLLPRLYGQYFNLIALFSSKSAGKKAYELFCSPRKGEVKPHQKEFLEAAKDRTLYYQNTTIQTYLWPGDKETILLVHGWESNTYRWKNLIDLLQKERYNIVAIDAPAHGNSTGNMLNVILYNEALEPTIAHYQPKYIISHSAGGMAAVYNAYTHPNTIVEKLVTIGAPSELAALTAYYKNLLGFNNRVLQSLDSYVKELYNISIHDFSTLEGVKTLRKPGLLLHDEEDKIIHISASRKVHAEWKNSVLQTTVGLGHSMDDPKVNLDIVSFLRS